MTIKVLVTGGAGFIGSHIVDLLLQEAYQVVVVDNLSTGSRANIPPQVPFYLVDVTTPELDQVFTQEAPDYVLHLAAQVKVTQSIQDPLYDAMVNILGTLRVLNNCVNHQIKKLIFSSTSAVYGDCGDLAITESTPLHALSFYSLSKASAEGYIQLFHQLFGLPYTILRYANVYGPRQKAMGDGGVIAIFMEKMRQHQPVSIFGDGTQTRDFIYVKDVAKANLAALQQGDNEILNISRQEKTSINQLFNTLATLLPNTIKPNYLPQRDGDIQYSCLDNTKAMQILTWQPEYTLSQGLHATLKGYSASNLPIKRSGAT